MFEKEITYTDFNDNQRTEKFYFHLSEAELMKMDLQEEGGLEAVINRITNTQDLPKLEALFCKFIEASYGEKSDDGKRFMKTTDAGVPLVKYFEETNAYSELYIELATNVDSAIEFITKIMPKKVSDAAKDDIDAKVAEIKANNVSSISTNA